MKRWYVVQVYTGFEEVVKDELEKRIASGGLSDLFGEVLVPTGELASFWGEEEEKKEKIFPGYVLVQLEPVVEAFRLVSGLSRVYKFLGGESPSPLSNKEVERIFSQMKGQIAVATSTLPFSVGSEVHIVNGPFAGFVGVIDKIDEEHRKLSVMVSIFGRLTPVELDFNQIKK